MLRETTEALKQVGGVCGYLFATAFAYLAPFLELLSGLSMYVVFGYICDLC